MAGVSTATVSHVINNTRFVGEETRQKVLSAIDLTGYQPNIHARNLGARNNSTVVTHNHNPVATDPYLFGLLIPGLGQTEIFEPICQGMARAGRAGGHALLWGDAEQHTGNKEEQVKRLCEYYISRKVSGIFFAPFELTKGKDDINQWVIEKLEEAGIPIVLLDRDIYPYPRRSKFDLVGIDNRRVGYVTTAHLIEHGCKRLAFLAVPNSAPTVSARSTGFCDALRDFGLAGDKDSVVLISPDDHKAVQRLLQDLQPDGLVCGNDITAAHLMRTLQALNARIPQELKIVGVDDVKYAGLLAVPLTTIHQPCLELGEVAVSAMLERILSPALPSREILLDFALVIRNSCGCAADSYPAPLNSH